MTAPPTITTQIRPPRSRQQLPAKPARPKSSDAGLTALFLDMLAAEQGAGSNTLDAYRRDLTDFSDYLARAGADFTGADTEALRGYLADLDTRGFKSTSAWRGGCRRCGISTASCSTSGSARDDPAAILSGPKRGRGLPKVLSISDVDRMLTRAKELTQTDVSPRAAAARAAALLPARGALRHRPARLRAGVAAGLRGAARCADDRGARQGQQGAAGAAERRLAPGDGGLPRGAGGDEAEKKKAAPSKWLFPSSGESGHLTRQHFARDLKELASASGLAPRLGLAACAAPRLRQPPAAQRRGPAHRADPARPHRHLDHPDLHPCGRGAAEEPGPRPASARPRSKKSGAPATERLWIPRFTGYGNFIRPALTSAPSPQETASPACDPKPRIPPECALTD